jgi:hypothetical protein
MLFACSGISRFVTSAHLVQEFNHNRHRDEKLRVSSTSYSFLDFALSIQANYGHFLC